MDAIKIFESPQFGQVRIITDDASGELLFCAKDVTEALGYTNGRDAIAKHVEGGGCSETRHPYPEPTWGVSEPSVTYITESGVYALIFGSKQVVS